VRNQPYRHPQQITIPATWGYESFHVEGDKLAHLGCTCNLNGSKTLLLFGEFRISNDRERGLMTKLIRI
jgi:hypothetical protein